MDLTKLYVRYSKKTHKKLCTKITFWNGYRKQNSKSELMQTSVSMQNA